MNDTMIAITMIALALAASVVIAVVVRRIWREMAGTDEVIKEIEQWREGK